jgi:NTP pyrophosphatase (non-canonical NTP hydrolase)
MAEPAGPYSIGSDTWPGLAKLAEECGEVIQVIGKIIALSGAENYDHWDGTNVRERLQEELGDVLAAIDFVQEHNGLSRVIMIRRKQHKTALFEKWDAEQHATG